MKRILIIIAVFCFILLSVNLQSCNDKEEPSNPELEKFETE